MSYYKYNNFVLYLSFYDGNSGYFSYVNDDEVFYNQDPENARHYPDRAQAERAGNNLYKNFGSIEQISVYEL